MMADSCSLAEHVMPVAAASRCVLAMAARKRPVELRLPDGASVCSGTVGHQPHGKPGDLTLSLDILRAGHISFVGNFVASFVGRTIN